MAKLTRVDGHLELDLKGHADFHMALEAAKAVPGRRFNGDKKVWEFPEDPLIAERMMVTVKPEMSHEVISWIKTAKAEKSKELVTPVPDDAELLVPWSTQRMDWQPAGFTGLYPFQRGVVEFMVNSKRCINASDMGTGKTLMALSAVTEYQIRRSLEDAAYEADKPNLIICPRSVIGVWEREIRHWLNEPVVLATGTNKAKRTAEIKAAIEDGSWLVINWEQLRTKKETKIKRTKIYHPVTKDFLRYHEKKTETKVMREPLLESTLWGAVIADEAHRAKNRKSLQTEGLWRVKNADLKFALSGTPLMNSPDELWPVLKWLYPDEYTSYWRFFDQYVDYYEGQYGKIITGAKNPDALRFELGTRLVRRTKGEVLKDLPEKTRDFVPVKLNTKQRKLYEEAERQMWIEVEQAIKAGDKAAERFANTALNNPGGVYQLPNGASRMVRLQQIASTPALLGAEDDSAKLDAAEEIILDAQPKQFVVFSKFVGTCHIFVERLRKHGIRAEHYTGEVETENRTAIEDSFQAGEIDVIVGTIGAMKEGITLHAADTVVFLEREWTPAPNEQSEDRLHRVGQENAVTVLIIEAEDTVDTQKVTPTNLIKSLIVSSVINKDDVKENHG